MEQECVKVSKKNQPSQLGNTLASTLTLPRYWKVCPVSERIQVKTETKFWYLNSGFHHLQAATKTQDLPGGTTVRTRTFNQYFRSSTSLNNSKIKYPTPVCASPIRFPLPSPREQPHKFQSFSICFFNKHSMLSYFCAKLCIKHWGQTCS